MTAADLEPGDAACDGLDEFIEGLAPDDLTTGEWFAKLCGHALRTYARQATWQYFQRKYDGVPPDGIVAQRISAAVKAAGWEGFATSTAYSAAVAATIGTRGGASKLTLPAGAMAFLLDTAYLTVLQLRLVYDITVLYCVPIDVNDPEDMLDLVRAAFLIKAGEAAQGGISRFLPEATRQLVKKFYSGPVLSAGKSMPLIGKHLIQRNVIKGAIPVISIPVSMALNRRSTAAVGRHARTVYRDRARIAEIATRITDRTHHPHTLPWVAWLVILADGPAGEQENLLMRHLTAQLRIRHQVADERLAQLIDLHPTDVWRRLDTEAGDLAELLQAAQWIADVDGPADESEKAVIAELSARCHR